MIIYNKPVNNKLLKKEIYDGNTTLRNCYGNRPFMESYCYGNNNEWFFATGCGSYHGVKTGGSSPNMYIYASSKQYGYQTGCWKLNTPIFLNSNIFLMKNMVCYIATHSAYMCTYLTDGTYTHCIFSAYSSSCYMFDTTTHYLYDAKNCCMIIYTKNTDGTTTCNTFDLLNWNVKNITINYHSKLNYSSGVTYLDVYTYYTANISNYNIDDYIRFISKQ